MLKQGVLRVCPPAASPPTWVHTSPSWVGPEVHDPVRKEIGCCLYLVGFVEFSFMLAVLSLSW